MVEVAAGDVGGQVLAAGLVDEVRMDVVPVVFGSGKRYFGSVGAQHLLADPDLVIQGRRVLHRRIRCAVDVPGRQAIRRTRRIVSQSSSAARATKMPSSIHWNVQNRPAGWKTWWL